MSSIRINLEDYRIMYDELGNKIMDGDSTLLVNIETLEQVYGVLWEDNINLLAQYEMDRNKDVQTKVAPLIPTPVAAANSGGESSGYVSQISFKWSGGQTNFLLEKYAEYSDSVGPLKKFKVKRKLFNFLSEEINKQFGIEISGDQAENRYKCVMRRTKKAIDNNNSSGAVRIDPEYDEAIQKIRSLDDSLESPRVYFPGKIRIRSDVRESSSLTNEETQPAEVNSDTSTSQSEQQKPPSAERPQKRRFTETERIAAEYLELAKQKAKAKQEYWEKTEENKQKRHEDLLKKLDNLFGKK